MISPESTSYPILAAITQFGITDPALRRAVWAHASNLTDVHRRMHAAGIVEGSPPRVITQEVADSIHEASDRATQTWIALNALARPAGLDSEALDATLIANIERAHAWGLIDAERRRQAEAVA